MVLCLAVFGGIAAGLAILKAILTLGAEIHLCNKCSHALNRDIDELHEHLVVTGEQQHPAAAAEVRALQARLDRAAAELIAGYQRKGLFRRICTATEHLKNLDDADKDICSAIESLLAKSGVPDEALSRFFNDYYTRKDGRSIWSILFKKTKPPSAARDPHRTSPPPSPSAPGRRTIRRGRRRLANTSLASSSLQQAIFMGTSQHFWSLLRKETSHRRKKWWACCLF